MTLLSDRKLHLLDDLWTCLQKCITYSVTMRVIISFALEMFNISVCDVVSIEESPYVPYSLQHLKIMNRSSEKYVKYMPGNAAFYW